jgi:ketosteroid isomerase-like protein
MKGKWIAYLLLLAVAACTPAPDRAQCKQEVRQAEHDFAKAVADSGIAKGFLAFAADDAVLKREGKLIHGKAAMAQYFSNQPVQKESLSWEPDFVDVAASGDLAYTFGPFTYSAADSAGQMQATQGYFHTVWRR